MKNIFNMDGEAGRRNKFAEEALTLDPCGGKKKEKKNLV